jgi:hypothetical protein
MRLVLTLAAIHVAEFQITVWPGMIKSDDGKYRFPLLKEDDYKNITRQRKNSVGRPQWQIYLEFFKEDYEKN